MGGLHWGWNVAVAVRGPAASPRPASLPEIFRLLPEREIVNALLMRCAPASATGTAMATTASAAIKRYAQSTHQPLPSHQVARGRD
jgi:hypothetical protein